MSSAESQHYAEQPDQPRTLYEKLWDDHLIERVPGGEGLLWVDRQLLYEATSYNAFQALKRRGVRVAYPRNALAVADHLVPTHTRDEEAFAPSALFLMKEMVKHCDEQGIPLIPLHDQRQGIVHIIGPEQGFTVPGIVMVCCDSHTCTNGAFGALAFGIGSSDFEQVLSSQTIFQKKLGTMRVTIEGALGPGMFAKDVILAVIRAIGHDGGVGHSIEFAGQVIRDMDMEGRMTVCNMTIEAGARSGLIAPDRKTFEFLSGRPMAPQGALWDQAVEHWKTLPSDPGARFDKEAYIDMTGKAPHLTWGTNPGEAIGIDEAIPDPRDAPDEHHSSHWRRARDYMGIDDRSSLEGLAIDYAFIGSCTNSRLDDLRAAASVVEGRKVAPGVHAVVTPGSGQIRAAAEREGLDRIFIEAGFQWRLPGCSMCFAHSTDHVLPGMRSASSTNRNFEHRQGTGARTHIMSPAMVAAAAIKGHLADVRELI